MTLTSLRRPPGDGPFFCRAQRAVQGFESLFLEIFIDI